MFEKMNGIYVDASIVNEIRERDAIVAAFTHVDSPKTSHNVSGRDLNDAGMPRMHRMYQLVLAGMSNKDAVAVIRREYASETPIASLAWVRQSMKPTSSKNGYAQKVLAKIQ